jgi:hypothetical protein
VRVHRKGEAGARANALDQPIDRIRLAHAREDRAGLLTRRLNAAPMSAGSDTA